MTYITHYRNLYFVTEQRLVRTGWIVSVQVFPSFIQTVLQLAFLADGQVDA